MSPPLRPFGGGVERPCSDCGAPMLSAGVGMHVLIEHGGDLADAPIVCGDCARCARCRAIPEYRYPTPDGSCCAGCLTMAEQVAAGLRDE